MYTIQYTLESFRAFRAFPVHSEEFLAIKWISTGSLGGHLIIKNSISTFYYISFAKKCSSRMLAAYVSHKSLIPGISQPFWEVSRHIRGP